MIMDSITRFPITKINKDSFYFIFSLFFIDIWLTKAGFWERVGEGRGEGREREGEGRGRRATNTRTSFHRR